MPPGEAVAKAILKEYEEGQGLKQKVRDWADVMDPSGHRTGLIKSMLAC